AGAIARVLLKSGGGEKPERVIAAHERLVVDVKRRQRRTYEGELVTLAAFDGDRSPVSAADRAVGDRNGCDRSIRRSPAVRIHRPDLDGGARKAGVLRKLECPSRNFDVAVPADAAVSLSSGKEPVHCSECFRRRARLNVSLVWNGDVFGSVHAAAGRTASGPDGERRNTGVLALSIDVDV